MKTFNSSLILGSAFGAFLALIIITIPGCGTPIKAAKLPTNIPAAPDPSTVVGGHKNREKVQGDATDKIDESVKGTTVEEPVKEQTAVIRQANVDASAEQIAKLAADFAVTVSAQATEITRLTKDNTQLSTKNAELSAKLDDFGRKIAVYTANGLGALLILIAVAVGMLTKNLQYVGWCVLGSVCSFGAARLIGHWLFPWVIGGSITLVVGGFVVAFVLDQRRKAEKEAEKERKEAEKERLAKASDDLIQGVEEVRGLFRNPPAELANIVLNAGTPEQAIEAVKRLGVAVNKVLSEWITDADGTHDVIKSRRRQLGLL